MDGVAGVHWVKCGEYRQLWKAFKKSGDEIKSVWIGPEKCWSAVDESKTMGDRLIHRASIGTGT